MESWPEFTLGDVLRVKHGFAFKGEHFQSGGDQLVLTPGNFKIGGGLQQREGKERFYSGLYSEEYRLKPGDLLVAMTDLTQNSPILGSPLVVPSDGVFLHNQRLGKVEIIDDRHLDRGFAYFLFVSDVVRSQLRGSATGSTVRHTAPGRIYSAKVRLPPLATQRKIVAILSAYDGLIENTNCRIKLLEEMAQRLYREWFVDFHYPGHEDVLSVDSELGPIPQGWKVGTLGDLVDVNARTIRKLDVDEEIQYIDIASVGRGVVQQPKRMLLGQAPGRARRRAADGDIIWSTVRPNLRAHALLLSPGSHCVVSTGFVVLSPRDASFAYVYAMTTTDEFVEYLVGRATGSAYPAVTPPVFREAPAVIPSADVLQAYADAAEPLMRLASNLGFQVMTLRATRDLLLPRLMSGEIGVSGLDIAVPEAAA